MESLVRMKMSTVTDWIDDVFEEMERVPDGIRFHLEDLLDQVYIEDNLDHMQFIQKIWCPDLTQDDVTELFRQLDERRVPVRDQYAPRQRDLTEWIRSFCFPD